MIIPVEVKTVYNRVSYYSSNSKQRLSKGGFMHMCYNIDHVWQILTSSWAILQKCPQLLKPYFFLGSVVEMYPSNYLERLHISYLGKQI